MQKDWLEDLVVRETMKLIQDDVVIDKIVQLVMDVQNQENTTIPLLITFNYKDGTQTVRFEDTLTADCGEKSLRLRSNESPSGAFEQQNGLAQARWRGLAPTSSDLSSSAGPKAPQTNLFVCGAFLFAHSVVRK